MIHIKEAQVLYKKWQEMRAENPALVCDHPALLRSLPMELGKQVIVFVQRAAPFLKSKKNKYALFFYNPFD